MECGVRTECGFTLVVLALARLFLKLALHLYLLLSSSIISRNSSRDYPYYLVPHLSPAQIYPFCTLLGASDHGSSSMLPLQALERYLILAQV